MIIRVAAVAFAALALAGPAAAACAHPRTSLTSLEGQIMCPTCHTTLDQSDSAVALRIEAQIRKRIAQCWTADQIKSELVGNFGPAVLAAPPHKGFDLLAWWLPLGGIMLAAVLLAGSVWHWSHRRDDTAPPAEEALDADTERQIDELLARLD